MVRCSSVTAFAFVLMTAVLAAQENDRRAVPIRVNPAGLAELIDQLGGQRVTLPTARVLVVLNPRAFLIESASPLAPIVGNLDRLVVLVHEGALGVDPELIVGSNVTVLGIARTLLGMQVSREVPWPTQLTPEIVKRFEIRAAVLASSVRTADGVELTARASSAVVR